ncbi:MAG: hypothetical protein KBS63_04155 [Clostridiales bacterium]|nr:hypothetical protein [Candidatus Crickella caballi]
MKYYFIVNPASGQSKAQTETVPLIEKLISENPDKDIKIYYTAGRNDAAILADYLAKEANDEVIVFGCGGDGTLQEVANGIYGHDNATLAVVPNGSGNDFVRAIGGGLKAAHRYKNLPAQLNGNIKKMDVLKMTYEENGKTESRIVINGINIGFDGNSAILASEYKHLPFIEGTMAYVLAVAKNLIQKNGENLRITADDKLFYEGSLLLATAGNGGFCGGGFESCPRADLFDGLLELLVINDVTRAVFISLVSKYKNGKILDIKRKGLYTYSQAKKIVIEPLANPTMKFVADGEIFETGKLTVEVVPEAIKVVEL